MANLDWRDGAPVSVQFDDPYFSTADGLAETRHVFLEGNGLPAAFSGKESFSIYETGFGTGLNFVTAWEGWRQAGRPCRLHYVSVEAYPLSRDEIERALKPWGELENVAAELVSAYPLDRHPGVHRVIFEDGMVSLTLLIGEAADRLGQMEGAADAWFLDGFAPAKNPEMWRDEVIAQVARLSKPGTTLATFTAAGAVRRALGEAGFAVEKCPGHGTKRDMTIARYEADAKPSDLEPWFHYNPATKPKKVMVIGGGVAGCSVADALFRRGVETVIVERRASLAAEASGNPRGLLMPRLDAGGAAPGRFYATAFQYLIRRMEELGGPAGFDPCGVLHLAMNDREAERWRKIADSAPLPPNMLRFVDADEATQLAGAPIKKSALWFAQAGWVRPPALCRELAKGVPKVVTKDVQSLEKGEGGVWRALDINGEVLQEADAVVIANGAHAAQFSQTNWIPMSAWRGQISSVPKDDTTPDLKTALAGPAYILPSDAGTFLFGATYDAWAADDPTPVREEDHQRNIDDLNETMPDFGIDRSVPGIQGRAALRAVGPDRMPLVGPAPQHEAFLEAYAGLRKDAKRRDFQASEHHDGLWMITGLGSRGLVSAPLCGELLASRMLGEPWPLGRDEAATLHPSRFIARGLMKNKM